MILPIRGLPALWTSVAFSALSLYATVSAYAQNAQLVENIAAGSDSSFVNETTGFKGCVYFSATDAVSGNEIWRSDGTLAGTAVFEDIVPGAGDSFPYGFLPVGETLFFVAADLTHGYELWATDGATNTRMVRNIRSGSSGSFPGNLTAHDGMLYFTANDGTNGAELWRSDGPEGGTVMVKDIHAMSASSSPQNLISIDDKLFFSAFDATARRELWVSDGTDAGTLRLTDIFPGRDGVPPVATPIELNGELYFVGEDSAHGQELWRSDGTPGGTSRVKDINPGPAGSSIRHFFQSGPRLYFRADDGVHGKELWYTDGTEQGTKLLKDIHPGGDSSPQPLFGDNRRSRLLFIAFDEAHGSELWRTDGTEAGTRIIADINPGPGSSLFPVGEAPEGESQSTELIRGPGNRIYFGANDGVHGKELWRARLSGDAPFMVADLNPGPGSFNPQRFASLGGTVFFAGTTDSLGEELYKDGGGGQFRVNSTFLSLSSLPGATEFVATLGAVNNQVIVVERSLDLVNWIPVSTQTVMNGVVTITNTVAPPPAGAYFRARRP